MRVAVSIRLGFVRPTGDMRATQKGRPDPGAARSTTIRARAVDDGGCLASSGPMVRTMLQALAVALVVATQAQAQEQEVHFSPEERLDAIDAQLIATATRSIDLASYALTDPIVIDALNGVERRGVAIRIVLDPRERHDFVKLGDLSDNVRIKRGGPLMHLKAYEIDGAVLRTGSANFSTSGENAQDNDLIVIRDADAAASSPAGKPAGLV